MFAGILMFGFASLGSFIDGEKTLFLFVFIPIWLMSIFAFVSSLYKVELTETEIRVTKYLQSKTLQWNEISAITLRSDGFGFYLSNKNADTKIFISNQVVGFLELVEQIAQKCPELFR